MLDMALADLKAFKNKYANLKELSSVHKAIDDYIENSIKETVK